MIRGGLARVAPLLQRPRYEVFPAKSTEEAVLEWVPADLTVTVTASPAKGLDPTAMFGGRDVRFMREVSICGVGT